MRTPYVLKRVNLFGLAGDLDDPELHHPLDQVIRDRFIQRELDGAF